MPMIPQLPNYMSSNIDYCSFTDWSKGDKAIVTYSDIAAKFSDEFIFVALNPTSNCHAFHSGSSPDRRLKTIFSSKKHVYYITDLIKDHLPNNIAKNSREVVRNVTNNGSIVQYMNTLKNEIAYIGGNPTIVAFGCDVYNLLEKNKCILCNCCKNPIKIVKVTHFSNRYCDVVTKLGNELTALGVK